MNSSFDYNVSKWISQNLTNQFFDGFFQIITLIGDVYFLILVFFVIHWCFSKQAAIRILLTYLTGFLLVQGLKTTFKRQRPYSNPELPSVGPQTTGFSFPSGHSYSITAITTLTAKPLLKEKKGWAPIYYWVFQF